MSPQPKRWKCLAVCLVTLLVTTAAIAQETDDEDAVSARQTAAEKYKELTDPDRLLEKRKKMTEKVKPPFEFFRSQVAPFDILPYVKANQWNTLSLDLRANLDDFEGVLETSPVRLLGMAHEVRYRRSARLLKEQQGKLSLQVMLPQVTKEIGLELTHDNAVRGEAGWKATLLRLEPHQMIIPILSLEPNEYQPFSKFPALIPFSGDTDVNALDRNRYYRLVFPLAPEKGSLLSTHPLTWTSISHILWDNYDPELLNVGQQSAMIDWLHWGGQLIIVGGAGPSLAPLQDSFLGPYLPAIPSGKNALLTDPDLEALSSRFPPPMTRSAWEQSVDGDPYYHGQEPPRFQKPQAIHLAPGKSIFLTGMTPLEGARAIPMNDPGGHLIGVERRIGRGRILMLTFKPTEPALLKWEGLDTFFREIVLRRPPEPGWDGSRRVYPMLGGPDLSWLRYLGRDLGAPAVEEPQNESTSLATAAMDVTPPRLPVAEWLDISEFPVKTRRALEKASGITIPGSDFVLSIVLGYILALVPLNWLLCRFVLRRKELAWVIAPVLAFGFAIAVERAAAYDMGFDAACDEIDLLEIQGDYHRAHLSRFNAVYSTGRIQYEITYPNNPSALALPMNMERGLRGDEIVHSAWQTTPEPALLGFPVQPRSLAMYRAEEMVNLPGGCTLSKDGNTYRVLNSTNLELRDAMLIHVAGKDRPEERFALGSIPPNGEAVGKPVVLKKTKPGTKIVEEDWVKVDKPKGRKNPLSNFSPGMPFLEMLRSYNWNRPEDAGEWRLVGWSPKPQDGQKITPKVDRHRGFQLVVAHLSYGGDPLPSPPSDEKTAQAP